MRLATATCLLFAATAAADEKAQPSVFDYKVKTIDGKDASLDKYKGKVLLVVNVASQCGYTPQYEGLQKVHDKYKDRGLVVLGFPSNDFGAQEPGTNEEIKQFCTSKYHVEFDMFSKIAVKGKKQDPLYKHLTASAKPAGDVTWNFEKFLVGRDGKVVKRFRSGEKPESDAVVKAIEAELAKENA